MKQKKSIILLAAIVVVALVLFSMFSDKEDKTEEVAVLTINEAKTITVGDDYEKIVVQTSGVVLEYGNVNEVVIEPSVEDGEVTLSNIKGKFLDVQGGGINSIYLEGASSFDTVESRRTEGPVRVHIGENTHTCNISSSNNYIFYIPTNKLYLLDSRLF